MAVASLTKIPDLMITEQEAKALASAIVDVEAEYQIVIDRKLQVWLTLLGVSATIYVPKALTIKQKIVLAKQAKQSAIPPIVP